VPRKSGQDGLGRTDGGSAMISKKTTRFSHTTFCASGFYRADHRKRTKSIPDRSVGNRHES
jgi:predicted nucleic acid-binding Zn ribbon protein